MSKALRKVTHCDKVRLLFNYGEICQVAFEKPMASNKGKNEHQNKTSRRTKTMGGRKAFSQGISQRRHDVTAATLSFFSSLCKGLAYKPLCARSLIQLLLRVDPILTPCKPSCANVKRLYARLRLSTWRLCEACLFTCYFCTEHCDVLAMELRDRALRPTSTLPFLDIGHSDPGRGLSRNVEKHANKTGAHVIGQALLLLAKV